MKLSHIDLNQVIESKVSKAIAVRGVALLEGVLPRIRAP